MEDGITKKLDIRAFNDFWYVQKGYHKKFSQSQKTSEGDPLEWFPIKLRISKFLCHHDFSGKIFGVTAKKLRWGDGPFSNLEIFGAPQESLWSNLCIVY